MGRTSRVVTALLLASTVALAAPPKPAAAPSKPRYASYVSKWHEAEPDRDAPLDPRGRPELVLVSLNTGDRAALEAASDRGGFSASDLDRAAFVLREPATGNLHPVEPRVVDLVYRIQRHFEAQEVRVISGYRTPHGRNASNHGRGRAIDLVVPGATDDEVAAFARELGFVGVGIYPRSGFVHVDVRDRSYFWLDASGPGRRNRERGILRDLARKSDEAAADRGELALPSLPIATDVDAVLAHPHTHGATAPASTDDDDDDSAQTDAFDRALTPRGNAEPADAYDRALTPHDGR